MLRKRVAGAVGLASLRLVALTVLLGLAGSNCVLLAQQHALKLLPPKANEAANSLTVLAPGSADFSTLLNKYFPGLSDISGFQSMQSYLVLLRNDGAAPAVAYSIRWTVRNLDGSTRTWETTYTLRTLTHGSNVTLVPSSIRLVSPFFNLTPGQYHAALSLLQGYSAAQLSPVASLIAGVDGVVYSDFRYSGPEGVRMWQRYVASRLAAHDEAVNVLKLMNSSTAAQDLLSILNSEVERGRWDHGTQIMDMYVYARGQCARTVRDLIISDGQSHAQQILTRIAGRGAVFTMLGRRY